MFDLVDETARFAKRTARAKCSCPCHIVNCGAAGCECDFCNCINITDQGTRMISREEYERSQGYNRE